jgi:hypothetical protein
MSFVSYRAIDNVELGLIAYTMSLDLFIWATLILAFCSSDICPLSLLLAMPSLVLVSSDTCPLGLLFVAMLVLAFCSSYMGPLGLPLFSPIFLFSTT